MFIRFCFSRIRNLLTNEEESERERKLREFKQISDFRNEQRFFATIRHIVNPSATELYSSRPINYLVVRAERRAKQIARLNKDNIFDKVHTIADIGTGDGLISKTVTQMCFTNAKNLYMFEPYVSELQTKTNYKFNTHFIKETFDDFKGDVKYDCVMLITALHHIMNPEKVIETIRQRLNKNGLLILREHQPSSD